MVVALRALHGQAEPYQRGGHYPVDGVFHPELLGDRAALVRGGVVAVEAGGDFLFDGRFR